MKPREYCCCAIPIVNSGIYAALLEQLVLGIVAGTLSIATPSSTCSWQTEAVRFYRNQPFLYPSRRCCHTRSGQMDLRHRLLRRGWDPGAGFHRRLKGERITLRVLSAVSKRLSRRNPFCSNGICRSTGSSPSLDFRYLLPGSSSPPLNTPRPKPIVKTNSIRPHQPLAVPLRLRNHRILSAISFRGLTLGLWEVFLLSSWSCR
jgi:hypothetical protein